MTSSAPAVPLDRSDVDTDQIIPSDWLKRVERTGFGAGPVLRVARDAPTSCSTRTQYAGATILVAGPNFGTGSSREHAVWALQDYGFQAVISPRFADIFRNNCTKNGLVPVEVAGRRRSPRILRAVEADPTLEIIIDVVDRHVRGARDRPRRAVPARRLPPAPVPRGPRRHRHHPPPRRRHRRLRSPAPRLHPPSRRLRTNMRQVAPIRRNFDAGSPVRDVVPSVRLRCRGHRSIGERHRRSPSRGLRR